MKEQDTMIKLKEMNCIKMKIPEVLKEKKQSTKYKV